MCILGGNMYILGAYMDI